MAELIDHAEAVKVLRKELHQHPELSGMEKETPLRILAFLKAYPPDEIIYPIGETGLAVIYGSGKPGPAVLFRCELDALPIQEHNTFEHRSAYMGIAHLCGHDGHMAIMCRLAQKVFKDKPTVGKAILLFQPAEETGEGALRVIEDPLFKRLQPDYAFALHNLPGFKKGEIVIKKAVFAAASKGLTLQLTGKTSHAAEPENGISPSPALAEIIQYLSDGNAYKRNCHGFSLITVVHAILGEIAFGVSPAHATLRATFRSFTNQDMETMTADALAFINQVAAKYHLSSEVSWSEVFPSTENHPKAVAYLVKAVKSRNIPYQYIKTPFKWSEDFGHFSNRCTAALFGIGAGENSPALHHEDYDFPDEIIEHGAAVFFEAFQIILNNE